MMDACEEHQLRRSKETDMQSRSSVFSRRGQETQTCLCRLSYFSPGKSKETISCASNYCLSIAETRKATHSLCVVIFETGKDQETQTSIRWNLF